MVSARNKFITRNLRLEPRLKSNPLSLFDRTKSFFFFCKRENNSSLEDLSVSVVVGLVADNQGLVPGPGVVDELLVLLLGGVELDEAVGLPVGGDLSGVV